MTPIDIGIAANEATNATTGSGGRQIGGNTYDTNPLVWIVLGVVALVGLVLFLKLR